MCTSRLEGSVFAIRFHGRRGCHAWKLDTLHGSDSHHTCEQGNCFNQGRRAMSVHLTSGHLTSSKVSFAEAFCLPTVLQTLQACSTQPLCLLSSLVFRSELGSPGPITSNNVESRTFCLRMRLPHPSGDLCCQLPQHASCPPTQTCQRLASHHFFPRSCKPGITHSSRHASLPGCAALHSQDPPHYLDPSPQGSLISCKVN